MSDDPAVPPTSPSPAGTSDDPDGPDPSEAPRQIGPYKIGPVLGEGGMGVVYLAEQLHPVRRHVALKILKLGMDTEQVVARFESERQALALMEHPSIARVIDAGATDAGRPFFVMERVDGVPITEYCDSRRLGLRERAELFVQVCRAVQHAHQKGVIHRDIKPSNVLVTESDGKPLCKVIDFGIARAVTPESDDETRLTRLDQSLGTPEYMSPEQVGGSGLDIDTRSDTYSLGVLLFELLCGVLPYEPNAYHGWALLTQHLTGATPVPSARFRGLPEDEATAISRRRGSTPETLRKDLRGDLDWIVMRALEHDRELRYSTPESFAQDIERHLAYEPVLASPPSRSYRARRFVRRHRASVAFAATLFLVLAAGAAAIGVQSQRIAAARDDAVIRRGQADRLIDFMLVDLRAKLEPIGRLELLDDIGDEAVAYFAALPAEQYSDEDLLTRSMALSQIGQVRLNEGRVEESVQALRESLRLASALNQRAPDDAERLYQLSQSHFWVGFADWQQGDLAAAEAQFQGYLDAAEQMVALQPDNLDYRMELGYAHSNLGSIREARGDLEGAAAAYRLTLGVKEDLVRHDRSNINWLGELAETHNTLAVVYRKDGNYPLALDHHTREYRLKQELLTLAPDHAYWRHRLGWAHDFLGAVKIRMGDVEGAHADASAAVAIMDSLTRHDPANAAWKRDLSSVQRHRGLALAGLGRLAESTDALLASQRLLEELISGDTTNLEWRSYLGSTHIAQSRVSLQAGEPEAAIRTAEQARDALAAVGTDERWSHNRAEADLVLGQALQQAGRTVEAETAIERALDRLRSESGESGRAERRPLLAEAYLLAGRTAEARRELEVLRDQGYAEPFLAALASRNSIALTR